MLTIDIGHLKRTEYLEDLELFFRVLKLRFTILVLTQGNRKR